MRRLTYLLPIHASGDLQKHQNQFGFVSLSNACQKRKPAEA